MPRKAATVTQADVARAVRAAKQAGAERVDVRPDGTMSIVLKADCAPAVESAPAPEDIVL